MNSNRSKGRDDLNQYFVDGKVEDETEYKPTCMRYIQLLNVCWMTISSYVSWTCMSPIGYQVSEHYKVPLTAVNALPAMLAIIEIFCSLPFAHLIEKYGASQAILFVSILNAIGFSIKLLTNISFYFCLLGQILPSVAAQVALQASTKFAATWFGPNERVIAVSIIVIAQSIGSVFFVEPQRRGKVASA